MLFIWRLEGDVEAVHKDPNPFGEEAFHAKAMMYFPYFSGFKRGTKQSIALDQPAMAAS